MAETEQQHTTTQRSIIWPGMVFALFGISLTMGVFTIYFAINASDPGVEPDYYQQALDWDNTAAQLRRNDELGWNVSATSITHDAGRTIVLDIVDDQGRPIQFATVQAIAFANTHASVRRDAFFTETDPGRYEAIVQIAYIGIWSIRVHVDARGEFYTWHGEVALTETDP